MAQQMPKRALIISYDFPMLFRGRSSGRSGRRSRKAKRTNLQTISDGGQAPQLGTRGLLKARRADLETIPSL